MLANKEPSLRPQRRGRRPAGRIATLALLLALACAEPALAAGTSYFPDLSGLWHLFGLPGLLGW